MKFRKVEMQWFKRGLLILTLIVTVGICVVRGAEKDRPNALDALERLKTLEGTWRGEGGTIGGESSPVVYEFNVIAGGFVVLEVMDSEGECEINVYYLDGDDLMMTHYCGGGNQVTMKLERGQASRDVFPFAFSSVTNLKNPAMDPHIHGSKLIILAPNRIESWWTVFKEGKEAAVSKFILDRSQDS